MTVPTLIVSLDFELFWGMQDHVALPAYEANERVSYHFTGDLRNRGIVAL